MKNRVLALDIVVALAAGVVATRVNDHAQKLFYALTPESEKAREPDTEPTSLVAARKTAETVGLEPDQRELMTLKTAIHYGLGGAWGVVYAVLRRRKRMHPFAAGVITGATLSVFVDETICPAAGFSEPNSHYPVSSHVRGFVTHIVYGLALAGSAELLYRIGAPYLRPPSRNARPPLAALGRRVRSAAWAGTGRDAVAAVRVRP
jgi:uncharacterized membrane protein YagU involved in acid resistance